MEALVNNQVAKSFTFDATNMMTQVITASGDKATYQYNGLKNRTGQTIEKTNEPLKQIQYILDLTKPYNNLLERKVNEDKEQYLWDNELLAKNEEEYLLLDDLGSPLRQLTNMGQTISEYGYDEFGQSLFDAPTSQPFGFTGYQQDEISGLNYAQARYYDQTQGRFVSEDTIKGITCLPKTMNAYSYVWNNPLILVDLDGNWPKWGRHDRREDRQRDRRSDSDGSDHFKSDWAGEEILDHYLTGRGKDFIKDNDDAWSDYMKANSNLKEQVQNEIRNLSNQLAPGESKSFDIKTSMEIENGESITGYNYLHGTDADKGGFTMVGKISMDKSGNATIDFTYSWNDTMDPNPKYKTDNWKSLIAKIITFGQASDYYFRVSWKDTSILDKDGNFKSGWLKCNSADSCNIN